MAKHPYLSRAWRDTTPFALRKNLFSGISTTALTLVALWTWGSDTAIGDYLLALGAGVIGGGLIPGALGFVWNLIAAPVRVARAERDHERAEKERLQAQIDAAVDRNAEAKARLRVHLDEGGKLRVAITNQLRGLLTPIAPHVPHIDKWMRDTERELGLSAPGWQAYFSADTGDFPQVHFPQKGEPVGDFQRKINNAHLQRFDRHIERLREIVYERL